MLILLFNLRLESDPEIALQIGLQIALQIGHPKLFLTFFYLFGLKEVSIDVKKLVLSIRERIFQNGDR